MQGSTSTSPSNHQSTAARLHNAGITHKIVPLEGPLDFNTEWQRLASLCGSSVDATTAWNMLRLSVLDTCHSGEIEFDKHLYARIMEVLGEAVEKVHDNLHLLKNNSNIGIARQVQRHKDLGFPHKYGLTTDAIQDHAVVLVQKGTVMNETSLIELKTDTSNCSSFYVVQNQVYKVDLSSSHGALGQALIYTVGDLLNCLARCGIVEEDLEILVLSGKKLKTGPKRLCYVRGCLHIPEYCGQEFQYSVLDFGTYDNRDATKNGLAAYFNTLSNGIERASRKRTDPSILCGRKPRIANCDIPSNLVGSPIPWVNLEYSVTQGEILRARLSDVLAAEDPDMLWMIDTEKIRVELKLKQNLTPDDKVLVKFGCQTVHQHFLSPERAYQALKELHSHQHTRNAISDTLLAIWQINPLGCVTITKELQGFEPVRPADLSPMGIPNLWIAFSTLVSKVLIPMAEKRIVHADLRPGWTKASNILMKRLPDGKTELQLIDYESVCMIKFVPLDAEKRTFHGDYDETVATKDYTALRHLMWQCLFTAYSWAMHLDVKEGTWDAYIFVRDFHSGMLDKGFWGEANRNEVTEIVNQETISGQMVLKTMQILGKLPGLSPQL